MENIRFTNTAFAAIGLQAILVIALVAAVALIWKKKTKQPFELYLIGAVTFFVSAMVLENIPKVPVLSLPAIKNSPVLTTVVASVFAGLFEETGRFIAFRTAMKKNHDKKNAISYGIGHGGFEALFLILSTAITYIVMGIMINSGNTEKITADMDEATIALATEQLKGVSETTFSSILPSICERISAMTFHISCSVLVFAAAKNKKYIMLYPIAILLHFGFDMISALYLTKTVTAIQMEIIFALVAFVIAAAVYCFYKKLPQEVSDSERRMECNV
ncbi:MAG TPA: YhfC family glutamic-type intramembrane protease [Ruminococcus flavefaciens]|nr:YhfC family glutamic-type intramembrane protease [Ruminococcus flavefaciens]HQM02679.1 YhfC family glutamic-type intramembrane protease [Ruminococcus flavefaciens]